MVFFNLSLLSNACAQDLKCLAPTERTSGRRRREVKYRTVEFEIEGSVSEGSVATPDIPSSGIEAKIRRVPRAKAPAALQTPLPTVRPTFSTDSIFQMICDYCSSCSLSLFAPASFPASCY